MATQLIDGRFRGETDAGLPLVGGMLYTYASGTTTPKAAYTDSTLGTAATNPIVLNARGEAQVWLGSGAYSLKLTDAAGVTVWTVDGLSSADVAGAGQAAADALRTDLASSASGKGAEQVGFVQAGAQAVARTMSSKSRDIISAKDFGAACDGATDDSAALMAANTAANSAGLPLVVPGVMHIASAVTITAMIADTMGQIFTPTSLAIVASGQPLRPEWWGADRTNITDSRAAFVKMFSQAQNRTVMLSGIYKFSTGLTVDYGGLAGLNIVGTGASLLTSPALNYNKCALNFDGIAAGQTALLLQRIRGLHIRDFLISHHRGGAGGGITCHVTELDNFSVTNVPMESKLGSGGIGWRFGNNDGEDCAFMGAVRSCKVYSTGVSFQVRPLCTSITFENCYQIGGRFEMTGAIYMKFISCASEAAVFYGYEVANCTGVSFDACAGEANGRGVFYLSNGSSGITFINPFGANNNSSGIAQDGDLLYLDGSAGGNSGITVVNPVSVASHANTTSCIGGSDAACYTEILGTYSGTLLKGIGGSQAWKLGYVHITGELAKQPLTLSLTGWTSVGTPTVTASYVKTSARSVDVTVTVIPGTSCAATKGASYISLPFISSQPAPVSVVDDSITGYANGLIAQSGTLWAPTIEATASPITFTASLKLA